MLAVDLPRVGTAAGTLVAALVVLLLVDRLFARRAAALARDITGGDLDPVVRTRLRFVRRFVAAFIVVFGVAAALSQFAPLDRIAATLLASSAIAAAVIGFAAQQSLGNVIAGVLLAVTQPVRIGDFVAFAEFSGVVEDIRLAHTFLQTGADARVIVPNGLLASSVLRNESIVTDTVALEVQLWLGGNSDELRALDVIAAAVPGAQAQVAEVTADGTRLVVAGPSVPAPERAARETELMHGSLRALRAAGLR